MPFEEGDSYCDITIGASDGRIIAEVQDPAGAAGRAEIELVVTPNEAPTAQILSPVATDRFYSDQLISFHAFVGDLEDNPEDLLLQWESSVDGELVVASVADSNGDATGAGYLSEGASTRCSCIDGHDGQIGDRESGAAGWGTQHCSKL